jgi:ribosomal protein S12 methylthiotransferase accessory factor
MPAMGITRIANVTGLDCIGIPVVVVYRPNSRSLAVSQGKGLDLAAAKASGLMESVESYHAERINLPLKLGSYEELRYTHRLVDLNGLPKTRGSSFHRDLPLLWIEGFDLLQQESVWLPYELAHVNYTLPQPTGSGCFMRSSNGLASGNHILEAISHAVCELVERDATTLWYQLDDAAQSATRVDLDTVDDPDCRWVLEQYERAEVDVAVWETTTDVGIPAFMCEIVDRTEDPLRALYPCGGMGCHPTRHVALLRALTEAAQGRLTAIAGSRDDLPRLEYEQSRSPDALRRSRALMQERGSRRNYREAPSQYADTFDEDLAWELERLKSAGIEQVVVVDLSRPEFRLPVARVVIPGLEGVSLLPNYIPGARAQARMRAGA